MKKLLLLLLPVVLACITFLIVTLILSQQDKGKGALQVTSVPPSSVYLNNKFIGQTPLCECDGKNLLPSGDYTIRLVPSNTQFTPFEQKITITKSVLTVVDRTFGEGATSEGSIITLSPLSNNNSSSVSISSIPSDANLTLDGNPIGKIPQQIDNVVISDHDITVSKVGYKDKTIRIHTVKGYMLSVLAFLAIDPAAIAATSSAQSIASSSAVPEVTKVTILDTPTGFLRVRKEPSLGGMEVAQAKPGESYEFITEENGWTEIKLSDGTNGWVSSSYVKKQ